MTVTGTVWVVKANVQWVGELAVWTGDRGRGDSFREFGLEKGKREVDSWWYGRWERV